MHGKARKCTEITEITEKNGNTRKGTEGHGKNGKARKSRKWGNPVCIDDAYRVDEHIGEVDKKPKTKI